MNAYGIEFTHRRAGDTRDFVAQDFAEFTAFAALISAYGLTGLVKSVFFDTSIQSFVIDVDPSLEFSDEAGCIDFCADLTLSQYFLFDSCYHKGALGGEA